MQTTKIRCMANPCQENPMKFSPPAILFAFTLLAAGSPIDLSGQLPDGAPSLRWSVGPELVRIGDGDDPQEWFEDVAGVVLTPDGSLVIGDLGSDEIRFFDATTGRHLKTVGGSGQGPGEINRIWDLFGSGAELIAVDARGWASRFGLDGTFLGRTPPVISAMGRRLNRTGSFDDGTELTYVVESVSDVPPGRTTVWMRVVAVTGGEPRQIMRYRYGLATRRGSERPRGLVFGPVAALGPQGDQFCVGFPDKYLIECFTQAGEPLHQIVREVWESSGVMQDDREAHFARIDARNTRMSAEAKRRRRREIEFADEFAPFGRFVAGAASELWVGPLEWSLGGLVRHATPRGETVWSVYNRDGALLSDIVLPSGFRLMAAGDNYVAGLSRDDFDVPSVVVYQLNRSR